MFTEKSILSYRSDYKAISSFEGKHKIIQELETKICVANALNGMGFKDGLFQEVQLINFQWIRTWTENDPENTSEMD